MQLLSDSNEKQSNRAVLAPGHSSRFDLNFILGAFLYWAALPPLGLWFLVFLVPFFWAFGIERSVPLRFRTVYLVSFLFWFASIWWIACPHPLTSLGLLALAGYLSFYWTIFFAASRTAVHRFRIPLMIAMPVCWIGTELIRNHLLGGFSFCSLEHALYLQPMLIRTADIGGGYLVGGMIMLAGATAARIARNSACWRQKSVAYTHGCCFWNCFWTCFGYVFAVIVFLASIAYGYPMFHIHKSTFHIAALQGNIPVRLDSGQEQAEKTLSQFLGLTTKAVNEAKEKGDPLRLIVWPETVCPIPLLKYNADFKPADYTGWTQEAVDYWEEQFNQLQHFVKQLGVPVLVGLSTLDFEEPPEPKRLNSALLIYPDNETLDDRYDKTQLVMFGEYIPFSEYLPKDFFLKTLCQEAGHGTQSVAMPADGATVYASVNICFESTIPHFVRNQVLTLKKQEKEPKLLINMSNDGWFWFSQQIDQHLATHVFRAVENRKPYITATNGGFAAIISERGEIQKIGNRREAEYVVGKVALDHCGKPPLYHTIGDIPAFACMICVIVLILFGFIRRPASLAGHEQGGFFRKDTNNPNCPSTKFDKILGKRPKNIC